MAAPRSRRARAAKAGEAPSAQAQAQAQQLHSALLSWYRQGHRDLPWRRTGDPYAIWVSEIMLQQTRVDTVKERFVQFMARFPTVSALAAAPLEEVLALWSGLGYYARARNLHAAAREVAERYGGQVPSDPVAVRELPGIGPYTAGAILSIAFGQQAAILDGNVIRVLSRLFAIDESPEGAARRRYWELSESLLPPPPPPSQKSASNDVGDFNQALMELGATVCMPQRPVCLVCPIRAHCQARRDGEPERYPPRKESRAVPVVRVATLLLLRLGDRGTEVLLVQRPTTGLWGGLWEPPSLPLAADESERDGLTRLLRERLGLKRQSAALSAEARPLAPFVHVLTHREMRFSPYAVALSAAAATDEPPSLRLSEYELARWVRLGEPLALGLASWVSALLSRASAQAAAASITEQRESENG